MNAEARHGLRLLICPQEFEGSLTAAEAAEAMASGVRRALESQSADAPPFTHSEVQIDVQSLADGGPGTVSIVGAARHAQFVTSTVRGPLGDPVSAAYALIETPDGPLAVIEAAAAAGLLLVPPERRDPTVTTTYGVGELIRDAMAHRARTIIVGVGGTATNDGGAGALQALGYHLLDAAGRELPPGGAALHALHRIDTADVPQHALRLISLRIAVDVRNPLTGIEGATVSYAAQKGADVEQMLTLEAGMMVWADVVQRELGAQLHLLEGGGAGGGLAAGLAATAYLTGARIEPGAALVAAEVGLAGRIAAADVVLTGEGRLDGQTAYGKTVAHVAALCRTAGRPCLAVAGTVEAVPDGVTDTEAAAGTLAEPEAMARARELVAAAAERLVRRHLSRRRDGQPPAESA